MRIKDVWNGFWKGCGVLAFFAWIFFSFPPAVFAAVPRAQLDESERHFNEAYRRFLTRDYWGASDYLDRALKANTYFVDYYILQGLAMKRIGDYGAGREAFTYYLEVRPADYTAPRILSYAIAQQRELRKFLGTSSLSAKWRVSRPDFLTELQLGALRPFNARGLGKAAAWGEALCAADTLGDCVYLLRKSVRRVARIPAESPAAVMSLGDGVFYIVSTKGNIHSFKIFDGATLTSPDFVAETGKTVIDAEPLSSREFAVADPVAREISFHLFPDPGEEAPQGNGAPGWAPPEDTMLFEPVALSAYGPWLAVADRGNGKVFFLNILNRRDFFSAALPHPRDVFWSPIGELFVINENGDLYKLNVDFRERRAEPEPVESGLKDGWALFGSSEGDVYCLDITASRLWKAMLIPNADLSLGFLSVSRPSISLEEDRESFILEGALSSPFTAYSMLSNPVVYAIWNNRTIISSAEWREEPREKKAGVALFHRPAPPGTISPLLTDRAVENGTDIQMALPSIWNDQRSVLTNLLIDSSVIFSQEELDILTLFCLNNGLELDIWARSVPAVEMLRASALTGGKVVFSLSNAPLLSPPRNKLSVRIPLPQELSSSGYPSRSMLTVYVDIGLMNARDWIPLWPDLLE